MSYKNFSNLNISGDIRRYNYRPIYIFIDFSSIISCETKSFYFFLQRFRLKGLKKNYTVTGVDLLLDNFFKNINVKKGIYIDVGCNHPFFNNYTYLLNKNGWSGINIDLDFHYIDKNLLVQE